MSKPSKQRDDARNDQSLEDVIDEMEAQYAPQNGDAEPGDAGRLEELQRQLEESRKRELQAQAELENFRKRMTRDSEQQLRFATAPLLRDLLEVVDNLDRALQSAKKEGGSDAGLVEGVTLVHGQLQNALAKHHCVRIQALGQPFDPHLHEAISQAPSDEYDAGLVMLEAAAGYRLHDRVLRPTQVIVSTGKPQ